MLWGHTAQAGSLKRSLGSCLIKLACLGFLTGKKYSISQGCREGRLSLCIGASRTQSGARADSERKEGGKYGGRGKVSMWPEVRAWRSLKVRG